MFLNSLLFFEQVLLAENDEKCKHHNSQTICIMS
jgi:hypothetical protein